MVPNGRSISSCTTTVLSSGTRRLPRAGPAESPDSFMKVWGMRIAARGPPGRTRPSAMRPRKRDLARGSSQRLDSSLADLEADVVARGRVAVTRVAEADDQDVGGA